MSDDLRDRLTKAGYVYDSRSGEWRKVIDRGVTNRTGWGQNTVTGDVVAHILPGSRPGDPHTFWTKRPGQAPFFHTTTNLGDAIKRHRAEMKKRGKGSSKPRLTR